MRAANASGLAAGGCGGPGSNLPPIPPAASGAYHLGPGDQIRIITLGEDRLTGEFRVNDSGAISGYYQDSKGAYHGFLRTP